MEEMLEAMIRDNGLRSMSVQLLPANAPFQFAIYIHWGPSEDGNCAGASGPTIAEALARAVADMHSEIARTSRTLASVEPHTEETA